MTRPMTCLTRTLSAVLTTGLIALSPVTASAQDTNTIDENRSWFDTWSQDWDNSFTAGFSGAGGNSTNLNVFLALDSKFENEEHRNHLGAKFFLAETDSDRSDENIEIFGNADFLLPDEKWFWFMNSSYEYDRFRDWKQRVTGFVGVGYELISEEDFELALRAGVGTTKEFSGARDFRPEALIGLDLIKWQITKNQVLTASTTYYPDLEDLEEGRLVSKAEWSWDVSAENNLSLKLGIENEYESEVQQGSEHSDTRYYGAVSMSF